MKQITLCLAICLSYLSFGQITLDHTYADKELEIFYNNDGEIVYVAESDKNVNVEIYSSSHSLIQTIDLKPLLGDSILIKHPRNASYDSLEVPQFIGGVRWFSVKNLSDKLIDGDGGYEILLEWDEYDTVGLNEYWVSSSKRDSKYEYSDFSNVGVIDHDGGTLMEKKFARFNYEYDQAVFNDNGQWKTMIHFESNRDFSKINERVEVYNLPGTSYEVGLLEKESPVINTTVFPNPAVEYTKVAYELPTGTKSATMVIYNELGIEVERLDVGTAFSDVLINTSTYNAGTYIYQMKSQETALARGKFVVVK